MSESFRRLDCGRFFPEGLVATRRDIMQTNEVANPVGLGAALPVIFCKFDRGAVSPRKHGNEPVELIVNEMKIGPFERLDHGGCLPDGDAIAGPRLCPSSLPDGDFDRG